MEQGKELIKIRSMMKRRKWWLIVPCLSLIVLSAAVALLLPNIYQSTATILIQNQQIASDLVQSAVTGYVDQRIQAITQEVKSRSKILQLVEKYDLLPGKRDKLTTEDLVDKIRDKITITPINAEINKETQSRPVVLTIAFTLSYDDENPKKAQAVANEISSYYMEKNLESREKHARGTTEFLKEQLGQVKAEIERLETLLAKYREEHLEELPEFTNLNMQRLEKLNADIGNLNMQLRSLEEQRSALRSKLSTLDPYAGGGERVLTNEERLQQARLERAQLASKYSEQHPIVQAKNREISMLEEKVGQYGRLARARERLQTLSMTLADQRSRYSDEHPAVKGLMREIAEVQKELKGLEAGLEPRDSDHAENATNPAYVTLKADLDKIEVSIASLRGERRRVEAQSMAVFNKLHATPEVSKEYNELSTDYQNAKAHYNEIQQKLQAAQVSQGMEEERLGETFQIVEPAFMPEKAYKPNRLAILLIGVVLGVGISVGMASVKEYTDNLIRDRETLEILTGMRVFSVIPRIITQEETIRVRKRRIVLAAGTACALVAVVLVFHFFVMDLYVFYAKLARLIQTKILI